MAATAKTKAVKDVVEDVKDIVDDVTDTITGFIPNVIDRSGRPVFLPKTIKQIPRGVFQVTEEIYRKILNGEPRVYVNDKGQTLEHHGGAAWVPGKNPGHGWTEVTDPDEVKKILEGHEGTEGA